MSVAPWDSLLLFSLCSDAVWCCSSFFITRSGSLLCHTVSVGLCHRLCWLYTSAGGDRLCSCFSSRCGLCVSVGVDARSSHKCLMERTGGSRLAEFHPWGFTCWPSSISARLAQLTFLQCPLLGAFSQSSVSFMAPTGMQRVTGLSALGALRVFTGRVI